MYPSCCYPSVSCLTVCQCTYTTTYCYLFKNKLLSTYLTHELLSVTSVNSHNSSTLQIPPILITRCPITNIPSMLSSIPSSFSFRISILCCSTKIVNSSNTICYFTSSFTIFVFDCLCIFLYLDLFILLFVIYNMIKRKVHLFIYFCILIFILTSVSHTF